MQCSSSDICRKSFRIGSETKKEFFFFPSFGSFHAEEENKQDNSFLLHLHLHLLLIRLDFSLWTFVEDRLQFLSTEEEEEKMLEKGSDDEQIRYLILNEGEDRSGEYHRIKKGFFSPN